MQPIIRIDYPRSARDIACSEPNDSMNVEVHTKDYMYDVDVDFGYDFDEEEETYELPASIVIYNKWTELKCIHQYNHDGDLLAVNEEIDFETKDLIEKEIHKYLFSLI
jgi:hypothetical protein